MPESRVQRPQEMNRNHHHHHDKRTVDMQIIADWVEPGSRVLDLGCGRGVLLEMLAQTKNVEGVGIDVDLQKVVACVRRGLSVYQGEMEAFLREFPDGFFDRVICSRTLQEIANPSAVLNEALRVGRQFTVGFVNHAFWKNRLSLGFHGRRLVNEVYATEWYDSRPSNPVSIAEFERFCLSHSIRVNRRVYLRGDWDTPCRFLPNLFGGYALYDLSAR